MLVAGVAPVGTPATPGTIVVAAASDDDLDADRPYLAAVERSLRDADFTTIPDAAHSRYIAQVSVRREGKGVVTSRVATGEPLAGFGAAGPAINMPLGSNKTQLRTLVVTTLTVRLVLRSSSAILWSGSAVTAQAGEAPVARKLAEATLAGYPSRSGETVSVP